MTVYQIAEDLGKWPEEVRNTLTPSELCEWGVYLNSPFSRRGRDMLMNGWLVHIVRSMVADKRRKPKFSDSLFPFSKIAQEFFVRPSTAKKKGAKATGKPTSVGEALHMAQIVRKNYEKAMADYRAGRTPNRFGLYVNERLRK